jgi:hypothetical protein
MKGDEDITVHEVEGYNGGSDQTCGGGPATLAAYGGAGSTSSGE